MITPWFAGLPPCRVLPLLKQQADRWGCWLSLTAEDAHKLMMLIEVEALRLDMEVHLFATPMFIEGPGMRTPAWSIAAKSVTGEWTEVV